MKTKRPSSYRREPVSDKGSSSRPRKRSSAEAIHDLFASAASDPEVKEILEKSGFGMEFAPYADGEKLIRAQQDSLVTVCQELGLAQ